MTSPTDAYWDELGIAWTAMKPDVEILAPRLKLRLRLQAGFLTALLLAGLPLCLAGCLLGVWTVWRGAEIGAWNFVTRGIAIMAMSLIAGFAVSSFKAVLRDNGASLSAMIGLALSRAQQWRKAIWLGFLVLFIANLFGLIGYALRLQMGKPPAMPVAEPLLLSAGIAFVLFLLERRARDQGARLRHLWQMLED